MDSMHAKFNNQKRMQSARGWGLRWQIMINPDCNFFAFNRFEMSHSRIARLIAVCALVLAASGPVLADSFRCVGADGKTHIGDPVPPECIGRPTYRITAGGIEKLIDTGTLTPEQQAKKDVEKKSKDEEEKRRLECQRRDKALMTTYTKPEDIDVARDRALQQATDAISGTRQHIADTQALQIKLRKDADAYKGKKMPAELKQQIDDADHDMNNNQQLIVTQRKELDGIRERYAAEKKRYLEITNGTASC